MWESACMINSTRCPHFPLSCESSSQIARSAPVHGHSVPFPSWQTALLLRITRTSELTRFPFFVLCPLPQDVDGGVLNVQSGAAVLFEGYTRCVGISIASALVCSRDECVPAGGGWIDADHKDNGACWYNEVRFVPSTVVVLLHVGYEFSPSIFGVRLPLRRVGNLAQTKRPTQTSTTPLALGFVVCLFAWPKSMPLTMLSSKTGFTLRRSCYNCWYFCRSCPEARVIGSFGICY